MEEAREYSTEQLASLLPRPAADANKYSRGKALLVAGCAKYPGAACLAASAAQRTGAGYTEVLCAPESVAAVRAASPSLVVSSWDELLALEDGRDAAPEGHAVLDAPERAAARDAAREAIFPPARAGHPRAYLAGSGFDARDPQSAALVRAVLRNAAAPVVVDGGGLACLAEPDAREILRARFIEGRATIVTPHAGEAARMAKPLGIPTGDPARLAYLLSLAYGVVAVVKGPVTWISDGDQVIRMGEGTPALAKAGTGDVLAGMTVALAAQGLGPVDACALATALHARAGRAAAERLTEVCTTAEDVVASLPEAVRSLDPRA